MPPLRVLLVHPGAAWSTHDVWTGMRAGLVAAGCEVIDYRLDEALAFFGLTFQAAEQGGIHWESGSRPNVSGFAGIKCVAELVNVSPDLLVSVSGHNLHQSVPLMARKLGIPTAVYCTESPYFGEFERQFAKQYDVIFTNERRAVPFFQEVAPGRAHYLAHAYNPAVHHPRAGVDPALASDVFFVGSGFPERVRLFQAVDWTGINAAIKGFLWNGEAELDPADVVPNDQAVAYYRAAAICLNHHRTTTVYGAHEHISALDADSLGPRAYEIPASGGFMLCDDSRAELREVFGDTVPTYRSHSAIDLERQVRHYLARPDERARLAAAQREAVAPHTWHARAQQMLDVIDAQVSLGRAA